MGKRIAFTGSIFTGKSTQAEILAGYDGWAHLNYTDRLKEYAAQMLSLILGHTITVQDINNNKEHYRAFLQELGTVLDFDGGFGLEDMINSAPRGKFIVLQAVRSGRQATILRDYGFLIVELQITGDEQLRRARERGITLDELKEKLKHPAEQRVTGDVVINAELPVPEVTDILLRLSGWFDEVGRAA